MLRGAFIVLSGLLILISPASGDTANSKKDLCAPDGAAEAQASPPPVEAMEDAAVGDQWTYEAHDDITKTVTGLMTYTVTEVTPAEVSIRIETAGKTGYAFQTFDHAWNMLSGGDWKYAPNDGTGIQSPLAAGKTWSFKSTDSFAQHGVTFRRNGASIVSAVENVTIPAGTFATCKIETSFSDRPAADPRKQLQSAIVSWYAPAINHWVKRTFTSRLDGKVTTSTSMELLEYNRSK